jgi:putative transposase
LNINPDVNKRQVNYRDLFTHHINPKLIEDIRKTMNKYLVLGNDQFKLVIEVISGISVIEWKRGRTIGWKKEEK